MLCLVSFSLTNTGDFQLLTDSTCHQCTHLVPSVSFVETSTGVETDLQLSMLNFFQTCFGIGWLSDLYCTITGVLDNFYSQKITQLSKVFNITLLCQCQFKLVDVFEIVSTHEVSSMYIPTIRDHLPYLTYMHGSLLAWIQHPLDIG